MAEQSVSIEKREEDEVLSCELEVGVTGLNSLHSADGLAGLGVSAFDQYEFEAGVMRELDLKAAEQAKEQQRKFAAKELRDVRSAVHRTKNDVSCTSRKITSLLLRPLSSVVSELQKQKELQKDMKFQLQQLEEREKTLRECLAKDDFQSLDSNPILPLRAVSVNDMSRDPKSHDLIKTGLLTPFGTASTDKGVGSAVKVDVSKQVSSSLTLADFNWLGTGDQTLRQDKGKGLGKGKGPGKFKISSRGEETSLDHTFTDKIDGSGPILNNHMRNDISSSRNKNEESVHGNESTYSSEEDSPTRKERRKRKKALEEEEVESEDELVHVNWVRRGSGRSDRKRRGGGGEDDGDYNQYKERMRKYRLSRLVEEEPEEDPPVEFDGGFKVPSSIWQKLYRYQQTGVKWMWELHCQQAGGIMGDEMGLGKTIQMIAFLAGLKISNLRSHVTRRVGLGPVLIVCPATVLYQWVAEFHKWSPEFRVAVLHDTGSFAGTKASLLNAIIQCDGVVVTTYANIRLYSDLLLRYQWDYVVLDEGHKIRNPDAEITLTCKQFATPHRIILSGSPMQNNLKELWSLFDFVFPGKLGTLPVFMEQFSVPITLGGYVNASQIQVETAYRCACILRDTINPYLLRRLKSDVKLQLPNKNEQVLFCRLTDYQRELYEDYVKGPEVEAMLNGRRWVFSGLIKLRKLCNHPDLVTLEYQSGRASLDGEEEDEQVEDGVVSAGEGEIGFIDTSRIRKKGKGVATGDEEVFGHFSRSGKMVVVATLLKMWQKQQHKVLLFTQSRVMLKIFESFLISSNYPYLKMDGGTAISARQKLIKKFNEDPDVFVFLLTTRVGGLGVNLTGADRVIIYDPDWNPSTDTQARERAWRIGQKRPVTIYRLLTSGTIEEKIYHRQIFKQFLTNRVLRDPRQRRFFKSNDLYELFTLGSSEGPHKTETGAIFAGTGSEVNMPKKEKRKRHHEEQRQEKTSWKKDKVIMTNESNRTLEKPNGSNREETNGSLEEANGTLEKLNGSNREETNGTAEEVNGTLVESTGAIMQGDNGRPDSTKSTTVALSDDAGPSGLSTERSNDDLPVEQVVEEEVLEVKRLKLDDNEEEVGDQQGIEELLSSCRRRRKKKKKDKRRKGRKRRRRDAELEGMEVEGLEKANPYNPGSEDEEDRTMDKQNNMILRKLFKKSGVDSAMQHDTIMSSGDPDFAIVEAEASRVARSAARALKESRQRCMGMAGSSQWGQPTWTGVNGTKGAPKKRFGDTSKNLQTSGRDCFSGASSGNEGSLCLSSNILLSKMKKRNAHHLPEAAGCNIHTHSDHDLMKDMRDYIACQCKKDGEATTEEILGKFAAKLPPSQSAVFRSMLHEICDFHRYHGEGIWTLKAEYR